MAPFLCGADPVGRSFLNRLCLLAGLPDELLPARAGLLFDGGLLPRAGLRFGSAVLPVRAVRAGTGAGI